MDNILESCDAVDPAGSAAKLGTNPDDTGARRRRLHLYRRVVVDRIRPDLSFEGSLINNADISYMTRIEVQGGGIVDTTNNISGSSMGTHRRWAMPVPSSTRFNSAMMFTISDSNLNDFSDAAVFVHPDSLKPCLGRA